MIKLIFIHFCVSLILKEILYTTVWVILQLRLAPNGSPLEHDTYALHKCYSIHVSRFDLLTIWILCSGNHCILSLRSPLYYRFSPKKNFLLIFNNLDNLPIIFVGYFEWSFSIISVCIIRICISIFHMIYFPEQQKNTAKLIFCPTCWNPDKFLGVSAWSWPDTLP